MSETTPATVDPLNYMQLRQLAECAVGLPDGVTDFVFNGHGLEALPHDVAPPDGVVLVTATNTTRRTHLQHLTFHVRGAWLNLAEHDVDAVFWSDAAVEKFVFPYCASRGACEATKAVTEIQTAWNQYPDTKSAVALLHLAGAAPGAPATDSFLVAYLEKSKPAGEEHTLKVMPVSEFAREKCDPPRTPPAPDRVAYQRGVIATPTPRFPGYAALRRMAEWASSIRETPLYFSYDVRAGQYGPPTRTLPPVLEDTVVIPVYTPTIPGDRPQPDGVWFQPAMGAAAPMDLSGVADAVFWSTGAIEQFLLPYYASVDGFNGLVQLQEISDAWLNNLIEPLHTGGIAEIDALDTDEGSDAPEVLGLVHLPRSVWMEVDSEATLVQSQVGMVHRTAGARTATVLPAGHFRERYYRGDR